VAETETRIWGFACEHCNVGWTSDDPTNDRCWRCNQPGVPRPGYIIVDLDLERPARGAR